MRRLSVIVLILGLIAGAAVAAERRQTGSALPDPASPEPQARGQLAGLVAPIPKPRPKAIGPAATTPAMPIPRAKPERYRAAPKRTGVIATHRSMPIPRPKPVRYRERAPAPKLLGPADHAAYRAAFKAAGKRRYRKARALAAKARDPLPAKVIDWAWLRERGSGAGFETIAQFIDANPDWPALGLLRRRAAEALTSDATDRRVIEWFAGRTPVTGIGMLRLGEALSRSGARAEGVALVRRAWVEGNFNRRQEVRFYKRHRRDLRPTEHVARLDRLLWDRQRLAARRMLRRVDKATRKLAVARLKVMSFAAGVDAAIARVPAALKSDPGLAYDRTRWRRMKNKHESAREILLASRTELGRPDKWWIERRIQIRKLLVKGQISDAYRVAAEHGLKSGAGFADAEFLSGWIALRFLHDYAVAFDHFQRLYDNVRYPVSLARGAYWSARAAGAKGEAEEATHFYGLAAAHPTTYYGQLALRRLRGGRQLALPAEPIPSAAERAAFEAGELVRAIRLMSELGEDRRIRPFALHLIDLAPSPAEHYLAADLAVELGLANVGIAAAKRAARRGVLLIEHGYPEVDALRLLADGQAEPALLHAVARQESEMDPRAVSHAGARGLMQLMPATARVIARRMKIGYRRDRLLSDPYYNARLASDYLRRLVAQYDGSYVLALAAYNAGERRVRRWIRDWGDPRTGEVDPVDWVELIPFEETRNYVQRVLEGVQVYRARLGGAQRPRLTDDLTGQRVNGASAGCTGAIAFAGETPRRPC